MDAILDDPKVITEIERVNARFARKASVSGLFRTFVECAPTIPDPSEWVSLAEHNMLPVVVEGSDADGYTATTPVLPGCIAEGDTIEQALADFNVAQAALLEAYRAEGKPIPWRSTGEIPLNRDNIRVFMVAMP